MPTVAKPTLADKLEGTKFQSPRKLAGPVWKGPEVDGVTQTMLAKFLGCRERFRVLTVGGLQPADHFRHQLEYGNMWHICEEHFAAGTNWEGALTAYAGELADKYRTEQRQVDKYYQICLRQFPVYILHWKKHADVLKREPVLQEESFKVSYELPSGRTVLLRGKWDSVDIITEETRGIYLQEGSRQQKGVL